MQRDLAISTDDMDCVRLLSEWQWLLPKSAKPLMVGIFGDWVFCRSDGSHWHLDLLEGDFRQVAENSEEFNSKKLEERYRDDWFGANWADIALQNNLRPNKDECLGWKVAPVLGGSFSVDNIQVYSLFVYQSINGQLFRELTKPDSEISNL